MADFDSSLPVRTQNPGDVAAKIVDATTPSQGLAIDASGKIASKLDDASGNGITSQTNGAQRALDVGINVAGVQIDPRQVRALTSADVVTANQGTAGSAAQGWFSRITDGTNTAAVKAASTAAVAADPALVVAISPNNTPIPVTISRDNPGTEINNYNTAAAVASSGTSNHDYTVTALKTLLLTQIQAAASGKMKTEVQVETGVATGVFTSRFVQFNSTASPNMSVLLQAPISVAAGVRVRIIRTNLDNQAQDVYSTICGQETP